MTNIKNMIKIIIHLQDIEILTNCYYVKNYIYVFELEKGKWYVGKTVDINKRYEQHNTEQGTYWTSKYIIYQRNLLSRLL